MWDDGGCRGTVRLGRMPLHYLHVRAYPGAVGGRVIKTFPAEAGIRGGMMAIVGARSALGGCPY